MTTFRTRGLRILGHLFPILCLGLSILVVGTVFRAILAIWLHERVFGVEGWAWLFLVGMRMDAVLMGYALVAAPLFLLVPARWWRFARRPWQIYAVGILMLILTFELASFRFLDEFDHRPDRLFWEYLRYPKEVAATVFTSAWLSVLIAVITLPVAVWGLWKASDRVHAITTPWPFWISLPCFPLLTGLIILDARGTLDHRPVNVSNAAFSTENLLNQLASNPTMTGVYGLVSLGNESDPSASYGKLPRARMIELIRQASTLPAEAFTSEDVPTWHITAAKDHPAKPRNLVIVLGESFAAQFVGCLGGTPTTPNFDALTADGLLLSNLFATGTRTVKGMEGVFCGFPPSPAQGVVKLGLAQQNFALIANLLQGHGYHTMFVYGGQSTFDNMRAFMLGNGVEEVWDQSTFTNPNFSGIWGVSDEDLFREANARFNELDDRPFCALVLTTSNHTPFEYPEGSIEPYGDEPHSQFNGVKYADHALGAFFSEAKQQSWYDNTVFLVVADHNVRTKGDSLVPPYGFSIPGLLIGPGFTPGSRYDKPCSQIDLLPTVLPHLGIDVGNPYIGHDLQTLPADHPGRAIMQFGDNNGYLVGDRMVVHVPNHAPAYFYVGPDRHATLTDETWPDLAEEALAHVAASAGLYRERRWRSPETPTP